MGKVTDLHMAARTGNESKALQLIREGADIEAPGPDDNTPLHDAAEYGSAKVAVILLTAGARPNAQTFPAKRTPLHHAADNGRLEVAKALIEGDANVNAKGRFGWTPLHSATKKKQNHIVELLVSSGADLHAAAESGETQASLMMQGGTVELMRELLKNINPKPGG